MKKKSKIRQFSSFKTWKKTVWVVKSQYVFSVAENFQKLCYSNGLTRLTMMFQTFFFFFLRVEFILFIFFFFLLVLHNDFYFIDSKIYNKRQFQFQTSCRWVNDIQCPPLILAPLINMSKGSCENKSALFILLIFPSKNSQNSNLSLK